MEESGAIKPVLWPYVWNVVFFFQANFTSRIRCSFALSMLMYGTLTGSRSGVSEEYPSCSVCTCFFRENGHQVLKIMPCSCSNWVGCGFMWIGRGMCISTPTVLVGRRSCDQYDQQGLPAPNTIGLLLGLYTQLNVPSVFLVCCFSSFDP